MAAPNNLMANERTEPGPPAAVDLPVIRLLVCDGGDDASQPLINAIRQSGQPLRAEIIATGQDLVARTEHEDWDAVLLRGAPAANPQEMQQFFGACPPRDLGIPVIAQCTEMDAERTLEYLEFGVGAVVPAESLELLVVELRRQVTQRSDRERSEQAGNDIAEAEMRLEQLADAAEIALAYVQDGLHMFANRAYQALFRCEDADELLATPLLDLMVSEGTPSLRDCLKPGALTGADLLDIQVRPAVAEGEESEPLRVRITPSRYRGEDCLLVLAASGRAAPRPAAGAAPEPLNVVRTLQSVLDQRDTAHPGGALLQIRNRGALLRNLGFQGLHAIVADLAARLDAPGRTVIPADTQDLLILAEPGAWADPKAWGAAVLGTLTQGLLEVGERSLQLDANLGLFDLPGPHRNADRLLVTAWEALQESSELVWLDAPIATAAPEAGIGPQSLDVARALAEERFELWFEPIVSLQGNVTELYQCTLNLPDTTGPQAGESLWNEAERAGLAQKLDRWFMLQAIKRLSAHIEQGHRTTLFIDLQSSAVVDETFVPWLGVALKAAELPQHSVVIQIDEHQALTHSKAAARFHKGLKELRCPLSIRGLGQSGDALETFARVNADYARLAPEALTDASGGESLRSLVSALQMQGKLIIAPGVESAAVMPVLWQLGINFIQGPYLQAPSTDMQFDFELDNDSAD
ncbi:MAG: EAL domain-containing protein [Pseudomonadota bacterium]|nr:EAL domain-containing protein [Pseudomonadota bacterium]